MDFICSMVTNSVRVRNLSMLGKVCQSSNSALVNALNHIVGVLWITPGWELSTTACDFLLLCIYHRFCT